MMNKMKMALAGLGGFGGAALIGLLVSLAVAANHTGHRLLDVEAEVGQLRAQLAASEGRDTRGHGRPNVLTTFNPEVNLPQLDESAYVDPMSSVIGEVSLGHEVYVAPFASIRGDEGQPIAIGDETNIQDGVVIHALETLQGGLPVPNRSFEVNGKAYAVYIGQRVSLAHQSQVHGPARVDDGVFVGMQALIFKSSVGPGSVVEPGARLIGVHVAGGRYVPAGAVITEQAVADKLPVITDQYPYASLNEAVVHVNTSFAKGYRAAAENALADSGGPAASAKSARIATGPAGPAPNGQPGSHR
jgi:carbonic anhydrase